MARLLIASPSPPRFSVRAPTTSRSPVRSAQSGARLSGSVADRWPPTDAGRRTRPTPDTDRRRLVEQRPGDAVSSGRIDPQTPRIIKERAAGANDLDPPDIEHPDQTDLNPLRARLMFAGHPSRVEIAVEHQWEPSFLV